MAIVAEYSNSINVTRQAIAEQRSKEAQFWSGFDIYCRGGHLEDCSTPAERKGYNYAISGRAWAEMPSDAELDEMYADALALDEAPGNMGRGPFS